jgi:hypothetical protein
MLSTATLPRALRMYHHFWYPAHFDAAQSSSLPFDLIGWGHFESPFPRLGLIWMNPGRPPEITNCDLKFQPPAHGAFPGYQQQAGVEPLW